MFDKSLEGKSCWTRFTVPSCTGHSMKSGGYTCKDNLIGLHYTWPPVGWWILSGLWKMAWKKIWDLRRHLKAEVSGANGSNLSARARVAHLCKQQFIWAQACSLSGNRANLSASGGCQSASVRVLGRNITKSEHVIGKSPSSWYKML